MLLCLAVRARRQAGGRGGAVLAGDQGGEVVHTRLSGRGLGGCAGRCRRSRGRGGVVGGAGVFGGGGGCGTVRRPVRRDGPRLSGGGGPGRPGPPGGGRRTGSRGCRGRRGLLRRFGVLRVEQPHRVAAELGDQGARQPRVAAAAADDGVLRAGAFQYLVERGPRRRVLVQTGAYEPGEPLGHPLQVGLLLGDAEHQGVHTAVGGAEGELAGRGVGEHRAEAEHVAGGRDAVAAHLLGRHETGRADERPGAGESAVGHRLQRPRDAEVDDPRTVDGDEHVGRLEVAVDHPGGVDVLQRVRETGGEDPHRPLGQRPVVVSDHLLEAGARHVSGGDPGHGRLGVRVQHRRRPVAADLPGGAHLLAEARPELLHPGQLLADQLHGDGASPVGTGEVDLPHPAGPEPRQQPVRPDPLRVPGPELVHRRAASPLAVSNSPRIVRGRYPASWALSTVA